MSLLYSRLKNWNLLEKDFENSVLVKINSRHKNKMVIYNKLIDKDSSFYLLTYNAALNVIYYMKFRGRLQSLMKNV